jgi:hypothetical protein
MAASSGVGHVACAVVVDVVVLDEVVVVEDELSPLLSSP